VQVALQVALPELDGAIEPIIFAGRDGVTGRSIPQARRLHSHHLQPSPTSPSTRTLTSPSTRTLTSPVP